MTKVRTKFLSVTLAFLMVFAASVFAPKNIAYAINDFGSSNAVAVTIFCTNDVHGGVEHGRYSEGSKNGLSYGSIAQLKESAKGKALLVDAGDHTSGSSYANYDNGKTLVKAMKAAGYDFAIPGNHEFDVGVDYFKEIRELAKDTTGDQHGFDYHACNFWNLKNGEKDGLVIDNPYEVFTVNGVRIALVGIMTPETLRATAVGYFQDDDGNFIYGWDAAGSDSDQEPLYKTIQDTVYDAKAEADIVIGVGHLGIDESSGYNQSTEVIKHVDGFDAFIDGHSHHATTKPAGYTGSVPYVQTGTAFQHIGKVEISTNVNGEYSISTSLIDSYKGTLDSPTAIAAQGIVDNWVQTVDSALSGVIAETNLTFYDSEDTSRQSETRLVRKRNTNLTDLCADSLYYYSDANPDNLPNMLKCDGAMCNGGSIRKWIDPGEITLQNCYNTLPYLNEFCVAQMPGQVLLDALEFSYRFYDLETEFAGIMQMSGLQINIDINQPSTVEVDDTGIWVGPPSDGNYRIKWIKTYNRETGEYELVDPAKTYNIAGAVYFFGKYGDGFTMFRNPAVKVVNYKTHPNEVLKSYMQFFNTENSNALPFLNTQNSPLNQYVNFGINYENKYGAERVNPPESPVVPVVDPEVVQDISSQTGDTYLVYALFVMLMLSSLVLIRQRLKK